MLKKNFTEKSSLKAISESDLRAIERYNELDTIELNGAEKEEVLDLLHSFDNISNTVYEHSYGYEIEFYLIKNDKVFLMW